MSMASVDDHAGKRGTTARRSLRQRLLRIAGIVLVFYVVILAMFYSLQAKLIFPGAATQGTAEARVNAPAGARLVTLSAGGERVVALFGKALGPDGQEASDAAQRPTILFFYGNGMCLADTLEEFRLFRELGANVMIPDYLGYGLSGGSPSEKSCYATADAAYAWLQTSGEVDPHKIVAGGWSLGAAVALDLAVKKPVTALVMLCPFTSVADMAKAHYPFLPARALLAHRFENLAKIDKVTCPTLIAHGALDDIVPYAMSERLAKAAGPRATHVRVEGAYHNDFMLVARKQIRQRIEGLLKSLRQSDSAQGG